MDLVLPTQQDLKQYLNDAKDTTSICSNQVNCVQEDAKGRLFVATNMGLCEYRPSSDCFAVLPLMRLAAILHPSSSIRMRCGSLLTRVLSSGFPENLRYYSTVMTDSPATSLCRMPACWLQTARCIWVLRRDSIPLSLSGKDQSRRPPVAITSLELFNKHVEVG